MDNELLQAISELLENKIKQAIDPLANDIKDMRADITDVKNRVTGIESRVTGIELTIENRVLPTIQAIHEGQIGLREKITDVKTTVDEMSETVLALDVMHTKK